jgi:general nucleoside transport system ATP-binding protein
MAPFLEMKSITKRFPGVIANNRVDLVVEAGEIHALLGENGAGKSTLMQILYGFYQRDEGTILINGKQVDITNPSDAISLGIGMIHQDFMLIPRFSVVENIVMGLDTSGPGPMLDLKSAAKKLSQLSDMHGLQVNPWAIVEELSVGEQQRVEILKLLFRDAKILILDEPTAVLTPLETEKLIKVIRSLSDDGHAVIFITHKLHEVLDIAHRVTILRDGEVISTLDISTTNSRDLAKMMVGRDVLFHLKKKSRVPGEKKMIVRSLTALDNEGNHRLKEITMDVRANEIVGLAGVDGNGQSDLARALMGLRKINGGSITVDGVDITNLSPAEHRVLGIAYIPADRRDVGSVGSLSVEQNVILGDIYSFTNSRNIILNEQKIKEFAQEVVKRFNVRTPSTTFEAGKLSGGNLQKLVLGRELMRRPRLIIVEQPTRGLDIGATEFVRQQLLTARDEGVAVFLISTELEEIMTISDRIAVIYKGEIMGILPTDEADVETLGLMMAGTRLEEIIRAENNA